uniref:Uncharacterized protein n=1 Tax=Lygus hesperus TaxID=30085 RepID=A0A146KSU5_LYGHE
MMVAGSEVSEAHCHYQSAQVTGWHGEQMIHLAQSFPLEKKGPRYSLLRVVTMPLPQWNSTRYVRLDSPTRYLIVSQDREYYATLAHWTTQPCRTRPMLICPPVFLLSHRSNLDCVASLYYDEPITRNACEWKLLVQPPAALWEWESATQQWYYFLARPTIVTEQCPEAAATEITLAGNGILQPRPQCAIRTVTHQLLPTGWVLGETHQLLNRTLEVPTQWNLSKPLAAGDSEELTKIMSIFEAWDN